MTINLSGRIEDELFNQFLQGKNSLMEGEILDIYLNTDGGKVETLEAMLFEINRVPEKYRIIGYGHLFSCGFELFFRAKCERALCGNVVGMYHLGGADITLSETGFPTYTAGVAQKEYLKRLLPETISLCEKLNFTKAEIKKIRACHDLYFQADRMQEFLKLTFE